MKNGLIEYARSTEMPAAARAVFETAELVEMILLEFSPLRYFEGQTRTVQKKRARGMLQLLHCRGVNKFFKLLINGSPSLQEALFLRVKASGEEPANTFLNPLLKNLHVTVDGVKGCIRISHGRDNGLWPHYFPLGHWMLQVPVDSIKPLGNTGKAMVIRQPWMLCKVNWMDCVSRCCGYNMGTEKLEQPVTVEELIKDIFQDSSDGVMGPRCQQCRFGDKHLMREEE